MKIKTLLMSFFATVMAVSAMADNYEYKYRLQLKDKGTEKKTYKASELLSERSIARREKQGVKLDERDYPISEKYLKKIEKEGGRIVAKSKWNSTVAVHLSDSTLIEKLEQLPFVESATMVWRGTMESQNTADSIPFYPIAPTKLDSIITDTEYGAAYTNIHILNGDKLHENGYRGQGMLIGVIDGGFRNLSKIEYFDNTKIIGQKGFVDGAEDVFDQSNQHGTNVFSCMATNKPKKFIGTAPEAEYLLLNSEDSRSEFPIEEDYWAAAIEYADSIGVDVVNTSLGYAKFDDPMPPATHDVLDGKKALISRSANMASKKGIIVVTSAGNSGKSEWRKITSPADAEGVLTVGAIKADSVAAPFSSVGLTADLRVKPDVMSLGVKSAVIDEKGNLSQKNGTSFSSPIMCGIVACFWQAFPTLTNYEIIDIIRESSNEYDNPSVKYGFGIPDMEKAMVLAQKKVESKNKNR